MEDVSYLSEINESLEQKYSYLVVRIGENISFNGEVIMKDSFGTSGIWGKQFETGSGQIYRPGR